MVFMVTKYLKIFFATVTIGILLWVAYSSFKVRSVQEIGEEVVAKTEEAITEVVDLPYQEMTIPYLRKKTYEGKLGELKRLSSNSGYTSYIADYTSEGLKINGLLTIPVGDPPENGWPAIIFVHGYIPPSQYTTTSNYVAYVDQLAKSGFVVYKIDLRGHGESEGEARGGYFTADYVIDILIAYAALQNSDFADKNNIGLWGHSMAGNSILRTVAVKKDIPAAVIWAGAVYTYQDMLDYGINDTSYVPRDPNSPGGRRRSELYKVHGQFNPDSLFWKQVVPTNYLDDVTTAIQLDHAQDDQVVNIKYSSGLNEILGKTSIVHEFNQYEFGGHNITGSAFTRAIADTVRFYNKYLKD
jgi:uncharacterized protein